MKELKGNISISALDSTAFSKLSADYNPMHIDENYARRLQFGGTVIHGIHTCLKLLDDVLLNELLASTISLKELVVTFQSPVRTDNRIDYSAKLDESANLLKIIAYANGCRALSLKVTYQEKMDQVGLNFTSSSQKQNKTLPDNVLFPPQIGQQIDISLIFNKKIAMELFPRCTESLPKLQLAQLLATTFVVGMKCPGLNSIFSGLKLNYMSETNWLTNNSIAYVVDKVDDRFNQVKLSVLGEKFNGSIDAFFRPQPIVQPSFSEIQKTITAEVFKNQKALIVGGTRGLGEVTAKILAAAGADVAITYFRGQDDAERVCRDIRDGGGICRYYQFDVTQSSKQEKIKLDDWRPNYIYYFATPLIEMNNTKKWDGSLFRRFCKYYVDGLAYSLEVFGFNEKKSDIDKYIFFPSTIYVSEYKSGFLEYATAKATGEAFCNLIHQNQQNLMFFCPRLQRLKTDQTNAITIIDADDSVSVMSQYLREFQQQANYVRSTG